MCASGPTGVGHPLLLIGELPLLLGLPTAELDPNLPTADFAGLPVAYTRPCVIAVPLRGRPTALRRRLSS